MYLKRRINARFLLLLLVVVGLEVGIVLPSDVGGRPQGVAKVGRAALAYVGLRGLELTVLTDDRVGTGIGNQVLQLGEAESQTKTARVLSSSSR